MTVDQVTEKQINYIKFVAKWLLAFQSLLIIGWGVTLLAFFDRVFNSAFFIAGFAAILIFLLIFWVITFGIVKKVPESFQIKRSKMQLKLVFACIVVPFTFLIILLIASQFIEL